MIDQTLGHYRVLAKIGTGGMGEVYRGHDEHLDRDVALKILLAGTLADETARRRLRKEALALSKLNHSNIATVFDFDTQHEVDFLVMELVPGEALNQRLRAGALAERQVLSFGTQLAEGLAAAHAKGIVHCDLKPSNLVITPEDHLKILDFGLAKLLAPPADPNATQSATESWGAAGTLPYMSPEQLQGEPPDCRTDIYGAGAILYEMATAERPFPETNWPRLVDTILHRAPRPPSTLNARISTALEGIILKALDKAPERRYQSAKELLVDLQRLAMPSTLTSVTGAAVSSARRIAVRRAIYAAGALLMLAGILLGLNISGWHTRLSSRAAAASIRSLAVLPLENLSGDPEQEYFAEGMTEALITDLSKISALRVISRTSVMQYKSGNKLLSQIAKELNVEGIVEGSVQRSGDRVRINAQLIYAPTDTHLWGESYDRELRDVLPLQDDVARAIADEIKIKVTPQEQVLLANARQVDPEAHELYLKGRYYWNKRTPDALEKGLEYFKQATAKDPGFASAYAGMADSYFLLSNLGVLEQRVAVPEAMAAAKKALELDDQLADAHASLGIAYRCDHLNWRAAEKELKRAIELDPNYASAYQWYASTLATVGRSEDLLRNARRAQELDPLSRIINASLGHAYYLCRRYDDAIQQCRKTLELDPEFPVAHLFLGMAQTQKGQHREAIAEIQKAVDLSDRTPVVLAMLGYAHAAAGERDAARKILKGLLEPDQKKFVSSADIAIIYAGLGQKDEAFKLLEKAYVEESLWTISIKLDPKLDALRADDRFGRFVQHVGLPPD
jgi:serine/threonine protein kinase/Flp pilus assembly protein TadD